MPDVAAETAVPLPFRRPVMDVVSVIAGVVVLVATVPPKPFADTTEQSITVPPPPDVAARVPDVSVSPDPTVTLENPPEPLLASSCVLVPVVAAA